MARLRVRTVCGDFDLEGVAAPAEVLAAASAALPELAAPDGRIVYAGRPLGDVSELSSAGVSDGSTLVVLRRRPRPPETSGDTDLRRGPDQETIARVTAAHAKSREGQQQEAPPSEVTQRAVLPERLSSMESHLQSLLQAVEGLSSSINRVNRAAGERPPQAEGSEEEGEEELGGTSSQGEPSEPLGLPEPNPSHIAHLLEMGFSLETVRKALLLTNNRLEQATEWLLEHAGDPDAEVPLTEAQLQQLASRRPRPRQRPRLVTELQRPHGGRADIAASPELVDLLVEMGFERPRAAAALQAFGNNMDLACHWLLNSTLQSMARGPGANSAAPAPTAGRPAGPAAGGQGAAPLPNASAEENAMDVATPYGNPGMESDAPLSAFATSSLDDSGEMSISSDLQEFLNSLGVDTLALEELLANPVIQNALRSERVLQAFQDMVMDPSSASDYLADPEIGPALLQVHQLLGRQGLAPDPQEGEGVP